MGALGYQVQTQILSNNQIDVAPDDNVNLGIPIPTLLLQPESGTTDDLVTASNAKFMQQELWVRGVNSLVTITIKDATSSQTAWVISTSHSLGDIVSNGGNIYSCKSAHTSSASDEPGVGVNWEDNWYKGNFTTHDGNDLQIVGKKYYRFVFDVADQKWVQTTAIGSGGGSGGSVDPLIQTYNSPTKQTEPTTTDCDASVANVFLINSISKDLTIDITGNPASGKYELLHLIFTQDGTGGHTISWDSGLTFTNGTPRS